ncbi:hypothetical protein P8452_63719 [Trifolium repens]|nr:hypothetical protein P8452_63719 [Trifolium repens]
MTTAEQWILKFYQAINIYSQNDNIQHHIKVNNNRITHQEANTRGIYLDANNKCTYKWRRLNTRNLKANSDVNLTRNMLYNVGLLAKDCHFNLTAKHKIDNTNKNEHTKILHISNQYYLF